MAREAGVDEAGGGVREEPETTERALALEACGDVVREETRSYVDPRTNSPGCRMNGSFGSVSMRRVSSG